MKWIFLLFINLCFQVVLAQAPEQKGKLSLRVVNDQHKPIENATVELYRSQDSALVKTAISDRDGRAGFEGLSLSTYFLKISSVNYTPTFLPGIALTNEKPILIVPDASMQAKKSAELQAITVTSKKPFIQKLNDRIIVNVESSSINAGSSALDVLERSPGITIDQNDAISLRGRAGVIIMIDGKPTPMTGQDLATYLRGLPSNAIERIDIITNPSSKYEAAGNSGIIDIRMKKDQRLGANGTLTAGYGQGVYPKTNAGSTFNYRNKTLNIFGNYNYAYREQLNHLFINRNFYENGVSKGSDNKDNYMFMPFSSHTTRLGADFFPSKKTILGFVVNSNFNHFNRTANINTIVNDVYYQPDFTFRSLSTNNDKFDNTVANINLKHSFDSLGRELTADID